MTIADIIAKLDSLKPNTYTVSEKIRWLSELDFDLYNYIFQNFCMPNDWYTRFIPTGEEKPQFPFLGYDETDSLPTSETMQTEVVVNDKAFVDMYIMYLSAKIDYYNRETASYNNNMVMYNDEYERWKAFMNKTYKAKPIFLRTR